MRTSPIAFVLLGGNENRFKSKTTAKLQDKQTTIAMARNLLQVEYMKQG
jgi:hypothetical protein